MHYVISTKILDQTLQDMCLNIMVNFLDFLLLVLSDYYSHKNKWNEKKHKQCIKKMHDAKLHENVTSNVCTLIILNELIGFIKFIG